MKNNKYSSKDIRILEEIEHIQLNAGMYIGSTYDPTHLVEEALDNALDEALAGYAKIVAIIINTKDPKSFYSQFLLYLSVYLFDYSLIYL